MFPFVRSRRCILLSCYVYSVFSHGFNKLTEKFTNHHHMEIIQVVQYKIDSTKMFWESDMSLTEFQSGEFLQQNFAKSLLDINNPNRSYYFE